MKLLFLLPHPLLPPNRGNKIYTLALLRELTKRHDCDLLGFHAATEDRAVWDGLEAELPRLRVLGVFPQTAGRALAAARLRHASAGRPISLARYESAALRQRLRELDLPSYDAVLIDMFMLARYAALTQTRPTILLATDAYSLSYLRSARESRSLNAKGRFLAEGFIQAAFERAVYPRFKRVVTVSPADARWLERITAGRAEIRVLEIPADVLPRPESHADGDRAPLFICWALVSHEGIAAGVEAFVRRSWPKVRAVHPGAQLLVWGAAPARFLHQAIEDAPGVDRVEFVEDWKSLLRSATVFVYPQRCGSGQQTKVQSAMAAGLPIVTAPETAEGLGLASGKEALVCSTWDEFAQACLQLAGDAELRGRIGAAARQRIADRHSPERLGLAAEALLGEAVA